MRAVQLRAYGNPVEGLNYVDIPEPKAPGPNEVLIGVEFSPLNPSDLLLAKGIYGVRPALPSVIGNEEVSVASSHWEREWRMSRLVTASSRRFPASPGGSE